MVPVNFSACARFMWFGSHFTVGEMRNVLDLKKLGMQGGPG